MRRWLTLLTALTLALGAAEPAWSVIIASGNGSGNASAPAQDPGWGNVATHASGLSAVYLGNGWVLTANHVGFGDVVLAGARYAAVPGSQHRLVNPDGSTADLLLYRIDAFPPLPSIPIAALPPELGRAMTLIGAGRNRGAATSWMHIRGFLWGSGSSMRWGTAPVSEVDFDLALDGNVTRSFLTTFGGGSDYPAQAAPGDSGGAVFSKAGDTWQLAGVMVAIDGYQGQPAGTALYGNRTYAADLSIYRGQIEALTAPHCGLGFELIGILPPLLWARRRSAGSAPGSAPR